MNYKSQTLAAVVITHNNAESIEKTLESLKWTDEIIVLDRGSTDGTLEVARRFSEKVQFHPAESLSLLVNDACRLTRCDWVLWLEAGEWVEEMLRHEIDGLLLNLNPDMAAYAAPRKLYFQGAWIKNGGRYPNRQIRLFRRDKGQAIDVGNGTQASIQVEGTVGRLDNAIGQAPYRTLHDVFSALNTASTNGAYTLLEQGQPSSFRSHLLAPMVWLKWFFFSSYLLKAGFLDGAHGLAFALAQAVERYLTLAKFQALARSKA